MRPESVLRFWIPLASRLIMGVIFVAAAVPKLLHPDVFTRSINAYELVPNSVAPTIALGLPPLELLLGLLLLAGWRWVRPAAVACLGLLVVFVVALISAWARGLAIDCGCFGGGGATEDPDYEYALLRDLAMMALAAVIIWTPVGWPTRNNK